jgi:hypothetical protein
MQPLLNKCAKPPAARRDRGCSSLSTSIPPSIPDHSQRGGGLIPAPVRFMPDSRGRECLKRRHRSSPEVRATAPLIRLDLHDAAVVSERPRDEHPDLRRHHRREGEFAPHQIAARHTPARDRHLLGAVPVLHVEGRRAELREGHRRGRLGGRLPVVLQGEHVHLADALRAAERDLDPVGVDVLGIVVPAAERAPVQTLAVAVVDCRRREVAGRVLGRRTRHPTV